MLPRSVVVSATPTAPAGQETFCDLVWQNAAGSLGLHKQDAKVGDSTRVVPFQTRAAARARLPVAGELAAGYGVTGVIKVVQETQPLAADAIWRVTLVGENFGQFVGRQERFGSRAVAGWHLLQFDDFTPEQLDIMDAALLPTSG